MVIIIKDIKAQPFIMFIYKWMVIRAINFSIYSRVNCLGNVVPLSLWTSALMGKCYKCNRPLDKLLNKVCYTVF